MMKRYLLMTLLTLACSAGFGQSVDELIKEFGQEQQADLFEIKGLNGIFGEMGNMDISSMVDSEAFMSNLEDKGMTAEEMEQAKAMAPVLMKLLSKLDKVTELNVTKCDEAVRNRFQETCKKLDLTDYVPIMSDELGREINEIINDEMDDSHDVYIKRSGDTILAFLEVKLLNKEMSITYIAGNFTKDDYVDFAKIIKSKVLK